MCTVLIFSIVNVKKFTSTALLLGGILLIIDETPHTSNYLLIINDKISNTLFIYVFY